MLYATAKRILLNEFIPHTPSLKQLLFCSCYEREALYGGAARGGKTDALLAGALMFFDVPGYSAILLRKTFAELQQDDGLVQRSHEWLDGKARWNANERRWTNPNGGATLTFGYLDNATDHFQYRGARFQFVGVDEATSHRENQVRYLGHRLSRPEGSNLPLRLRLSATPGGIGHEWVKKRFITTDSTDRPFIPALLEDNPHEDQQAYIKSLDILDPITRQQMLKGDWDIYVGGRFQPSWFLRYTRTKDLMCFGEKVYSHHQLTHIFQTVDPAATVKKHVKDDPDYTVIATWAITPCGLLAWLGCRRIRVESPDIPKQMADMYLRPSVSQGQCKYAVVEAGGTQKSVAQHARRHAIRPGEFMTVFEFVPTKDKLETARDAQIAAEAGRIWLPATESDAPGFPLEDVESEIFRWTGDDKQDAHDDCVTALSIAAKELVKRRDWREKPVERVTMLRGRF